MPPPRPRRTETPLVFTSEEAWRQHCDAMDVINKELAPLLDESQELRPLSSELRTPELRGKPAFSDYMGARRGGYRMLLDIPNMGATYTVEHIASIRDNLAKTPDYIERITDGLAQEPGFAPQRQKIVTGLEALRTLTAEMQAIAQEALDAYAVSPEGQTAAGKIIVEQHVQPKDEQRRY